MKQDNKPINLVLESYQLQGARQMLSRLMDNYEIRPKGIRPSKEEQVYVDAELNMILSSVDNVRHFLCGDCRIHYQNHQRDKKGNLIKVDAYYLPR